ncbi:hypothetical protein DM02DRAFT_611392 [Periconia macrospinosa]|uniref:Ribosomal protein S21 n=1 Tax=Periconia macrospinosa TaxID=97972 RepID=A0A2V1E5E3_9PLEO|nr:hypothetical protein DM02DRAFT_611392 [Periconia macrospinosa]
MGSRSMGELLLRPSPTLSRLSTIPQTSRLISPTTSSWTPSRRAISNGPKRDNQEPFPTPRQARPQQQGQQQQQQQGGPTANPFADMMPSQSRPAYRSSAPQKEQPSGAKFELDNLLPRATSTTTMREGRSNFGLQFSKAGPGYRHRRTGQPPRLNTSSLDLGPLTDLPPGVQAGGTFPGIFTAPTIPESEKVYPRLGATYGRSVDLDPNRHRDLVQGVGILTALVIRNNIKNDFRKQKFHERPGLKRKRLASERWRARFKAGFHQVTSRVTELNRKGW